MVANARKIFAGDWTETAAQTFHIDYIFIYINEMLTIDCESGHSYLPGTFLTKNQ